MILIYYFLQLEQKVPFQCNRYVHWGCNMSIRDIYLDMAKQRYCDEAIFYHITRSLKV